MKARRLFLVNLENREKSQCLEKILDHVEFLNLKIESRKNLTSKLDGAVIFVDKLQINSAYLSFYVEFVFLACIVVLMYQNEALFPFPSELLFVKKNYLKL